CVDRGVVRHGETVASKRNGALWAPSLVGGGGGSRSLSASTASGFSPLVCKVDSAVRVWLRCVEGQLQGFGILEEKPCAGAQREREDEEVQFVDEAVGKHGSHEHRAAADEDVALDVFLQPADRLGFVRPEDGRVPPGRLVQRGGDD